MGDALENDPIAEDAADPKEQGVGEAKSEKPEEVVHGEVPEGTETEGADKTTTEGTEAGDGEHVEGEHVEGEHAVGEHVEGEKLAGEHVEGEHVGGEHVEGEQHEGEHPVGEERMDEGEERVAEGEERVAEGEELVGDSVEATEEKKEPEQQPPDEVVEEEEAYVEEPPPDPGAPFDFSDSKELLKEPFELRHDQVAEVEELWAYFQDYTPAYTDIDNYITEKELVYMLKSLNLMTYTPEQLQELIAYCVRPPHPKGHIMYEQFLKMVRLRQREMPVEEELRIALCVMDPDKTGTVDREFFREVMLKQGHKIAEKPLNNLIKEVDLSNDGTLGIEDIVGTMCIDLNTEDLQMLRDAVFPPEAKPVEEDEDNF